MQRIDRYLAEVAAALVAVPREPLGPIVQALWETYQRDATIVVCGNGGSAASASHFACDLAKWTICADRKRVRDGLANHVAPGDANDDAPGSSGGRSLTCGLSVQTPLSNPGARVCAEADTALW